MDERTRLGRGLEEVSRFYLSGRPREEAAKDPVTDAPASGRRVVRIFHPGSPLTKSFFTANLALELARHRHPVAVWDGAAEEGPGVGAMLKGILSHGLTPDAGTVRLYGLPDILVHDAGALGPGRLQEISSRLSADREGYLLINLPDTFESVVQPGVPCDAVLICTLDEPCLLKGYAFIKVIRTKDPRGRIRLVFDSPPAGDRAREAFASLDRFVRDRSLGSLEFLGILEHDDFFERSIQDGRPLVLWNEPSLARDSLVTLSSAFLRPVIADS